MVSESPEWLFSNFVFIFIFGFTLAVGYVLNGKSFKGYRELMKATGHMSNFAERYGMPLCFINFGVYGFMVLAYMNLIMLLTEGVAFTGPTVGAIFAAVTFAAIGQHPKNTWSIFMGYAGSFCVRDFRMYAPGAGSTMDIVNSGVYQWCGFRYWSRADSWPLWLALRHGCGDHQRVYMYFHSGDSRRIYAL